MKINILGTGHGMALNCYNTCFTIEENGKHFLIDSGGGNTILKNLKLLDIPLESIEAIFISHSHIDHILGSIWIIRALLPKYHKMKIDKTLIIYGNKSVINCLNILINNLLPKDFLYLIDDKIKLITVSNNQQKTILNRKITFFDVHAKKISQYGFYFFVKKDKKFIFIGDEYCKDKIKKYIFNSTWLFGDAYMCGEEAEKYNPMEKHSHSSVKFISEISQKLNVKKLILSHTNDNDLQNRRENFTRDAKKYFTGEILIPDDLDVIILK